MHIVPGTFNLKVPDIRYLLSNSTHAHSTSNFNWYQGPGTYSVTPFMHTVPVTFTGTQYSTQKQKLYSLSLLSGGKAGLRGLRRGRLMMGW